MKCNDKELAKIGEGKSDLEGVLHHMRPQGSEWSDWYQQPSFKERYFKLMVNLLFYYRVNEQEQEPLGVLVMENAEVAYEGSRRGIPFAFSITFKANERSRDAESKHIFSCRCDDDVSKWVAALKMHSYEYWRNQYGILKTKISARTGQDPWNYLKNHQISTNHQIMATKTKKSKETKKATFYTQVETSTFYESSYSANKNVSKSSSGGQPLEDNLIDL